MQIKTQIFSKGLALVLAIAFFACNQEPKIQENNTLTEKVEVRWTWKRTRSQTDNVVYGTLHNKTDKTLKQVDLEFRTQDENGKTIQTKTFRVMNLPPMGQKPFTQDYPAQAANEDSGFVTVKQVISAD